ncbi:MAG: hypothetical protein QXQ48_03490 [Nitrososphaerota archaeon]
MIVKNSIQRREMLSRQVLEVEECPRCHLEVPAGTRRCPRCGLCITCSSQ